MLKEGCVHGRFQPIHKGHLEYILNAKAKCKFIWIGITQYDINNLAKSPKDHHRENIENNPFSYFERVELINMTLEWAGLSCQDFGIVPFPIENPEILPDFMPLRIPIFTTIYDNWNRYKVQVLEDIGYRVIVLYQRERKEYDGMSIRKKIIEGDLSWKEMVLPPTIIYIHEKGIRNRLLQFSKNRIEN